MSRKGCFPLFVSYTTGSNGSNHQAVVTFNRHVKISCISQSLAAANGIFIQSNPSISRGTKNWDLIVNKSAGVTAIGQDYVNIIPGTFRYYNLKQSNWLVTDSIYFGSNTNSGTRTFCLNYVLD